MIFEEEKTMAFVNAKITPQDRVSFGLDRLKTLFPKGYWILQQDWTVDYEKKEYLIQVRRSTDGAEPNYDTDFVYIKYVMFYNEKLYEFEVLREDKKTKKYFIDNIVFFDDCLEIQGISIIKIENNIAKKENVFFDKNSDVFRKIYEVFCARRLGLYSENLLSPNSYQLNLLLKDGVKNI